MQAALAAAAPAAAAPQPLTATSYHPAALAAADPNRRFAYNKARPRDSPGPFFVSVVHTMSTMAGAMQFSRA